VGPGYRGARACELTFGSRSSIISAISFGLATRSLRIRRMRARIGWDRAFAMRGSTRSSDERAMTADISPSEYDAFAPFYDAFTSASDYETWTDEVLEVARRHGLRGTSLLDLACGTGKSLEPLLRRGCEVTACDASPGMLAEASF